MTKINALPIWMTCAPAIWTFESESTRCWGPLPAAGGGQQHAGHGGFSPDGRWLAAATGNGVWLWDLATGKAIAFAPERIGSDAKFHPSGKELFTCGAAGLYRWTFDIEANVVRIGPPRKLPVSGSQTNISLDGQGRTIAVVDGLREGGGWLLDLKDPAISAQCLRHAFSSSVATSPDGRWVAMGTHNGLGVRIWDAAHPERVRHLLPEERITRVAFSPNGKWLVIGARGEFSILEVESWQRIKGIRGEQENNTSTAVFSPDNTVLAVTTTLSAVQLFDTTTWRPLARLQAPDPDMVFVRGFSPDGSQLVVATPGDVHLWHLRLIRDRLKEIDLDWQQEAYPLPSWTEGPPIRVEVDLGELGEKQLGVIQTPSFEPPIKDG